MPLLLCVFLRVLVLDHCKVNYSSTVFFPSGTFPCIILCKWWWHKIKFSVSKLRCLIGKRWCQYQSLTFCTVNNLLPQSGQPCMTIFSSPGWKHLSFHWSKKSLLTLFLCACSTQIDVLSLLFKKESSSRLYPLVGVRSTGQTDVRDHLHPLWAGIQRQPDTLLWSCRVSSGVLGWNVKHKQACKHIVYIV